MKCLITGTTGAIGSGVVRRLPAEGREVRDAERLHLALLL